MNVLQTYYCGMYAYRRSSADQSTMIWICVDLIRADLDQGQKVLLICRFGSGSSVDQSVFSLSCSFLHLEWLLWLYMSVLLTQPSSDLLYFEVSTVPIHICSSFTVCYNFPYISSAYL